MMQYNGIRLTDKIYQKVKPHPLKYILSRNGKHVILIQATAEFLYVIAHERPIVIYIYTLYYEHLNICLIL